MDPHNPIASDLAGAQQRREEAARQRQGHLSDGERPACGNCYVHKAREARCEYGDFAVKPGDWCAMWIPVPQWLSRNPRAGAAAGLGLVDFALPEKVVIV